MCCFTDSQGTKENILKVKNYLPRKQKVSARKLSRNLSTSATSVRRMLKIDLGLKPHTETIEPSLSDDQKNKQKQFANGLGTNFRKEDTLRILFSDEKNSVTLMVSIILKMDECGQ